jgi:succinate dehydrogenase / fumarate reductase iron-sulfur subunit
MSTDKIIFRILRYKPGHIDPPRYQEFSFEAKPGMTVLDALEAIRITRDSTLMYRHSCHHSSCGTCACKINGSERLACTTKIEDLKSNPITLAPLDGFKPSGDLVVDISPLYDNIPEDWSYLKNTENVTSSQMPEGIVEFKRFENCIECGACISACPVTLKNNDFIGPAVLAALSNELKKSPQKSEYLLSIAGDAKGESLCERAFNCSRVCPTRVYPGRQISDLHKVLKQI